MITDTYMQHLIDEIIEVITNKEREAVNEYENISRTQAREEIIQALMKTYGKELK